MWLSFLFAALILIFYVMGCRRLNRDAPRRWLSWLLIFSAVPLFLILAFVAGLTMPPV